MDGERQERSATRSFPVKRINGSFDGRGQDVAQRKPTFINLFRYPIADIRGNQRR
jgi:hypothetical protein